MKTRIISGTILAVIIAALVIAGGASLLICSLLIGLQGCYEIYKVCGINKKPVTYVSYFLILLFYYFVFRGYFSSKGTGFTVMCLILAVTLLVLCVHVLVFPKMRFNTAAAAVLGVLYPGIMSSCLYLCRIKADGFFFSLLIINCSLMTDVFAYFTGVSLGKHHPFVLLSPKKSTEGCIGGILGTLIISIILGLVFRKSLALIIPVSVLGSAFSMLGDLSASSIKREHDIKDYSFIIPGHGGVMDRFDSTLFVGVIVFICVTLLF